MSQSCTDYYIGRYPLKFFILVGSANLGTLYNLCFSCVMVFRIYIFNILSILLDLLVCLIYALVLIWLDVHSCMLQIEL